MKILDGFEEPKPLEKGVWDVDEATYRADSALNFHTLADFKRDPKAFNDGFFAAREENDAMRFGTACHAAILQGADVYRETVAAFTPPVNTATGAPFGSTTKAYQEARAAFDVANAGKTIITADDAETIEKIRLEMLFHPIAPQILGGWGESEVAIKGELIVDGRPVTVKARLDRYGAAGLTDFKTTASIADATGKDRFRYAVYDYKYLLQTGFYHLILTDVCGAPFVPVYLLAAERNAPHRAAVYAATRQVVEDARTVAKQWVRDYLEARETNYYPSPFDSVQIIDRYNLERDL